MQLGTSNQGIGSRCQRISRLLGAGRGETDELQQTSEVVHELAAPVRHASSGEEVRVGLHVLHLASNGPVPGKGIVAVSEILVMEELEASGLHGVHTLGDRHHVADTVTELNVETDLSVLNVALVIVVRHQPLVDTKDTAGLEHAEDLAVDTFELGSVHRGLNGIDGVKCVVREGHLHEVALDEGELVGETSLDGILCRSVDLVVVIVQARDMGVGELGDLAGGTTDTTANIQNLHALLDADLGGQVVLVAGNGCVKALALGEPTEVEGLAPAILVKVSGQVVVAARRDPVLDTILTLHDWT